MLQVARYLLKNYNRLHRGSKKPLGEAIAYLQHITSDENYTLETDDL